MFGVGPMEMAIIAVVALLIFGPEKLPEMMGQAGKLVRDFRNMSAEMTGEFEKTVAEARSVGKQINTEMGAMTREVSSVTDSVQRELGGTKGKGAKGKATTASKRTASGNKKSSASNAASRKPAAAKSSTSASKASTQATTARPSGSSSSSSDKGQGRTTKTGPKPKATPAPQASRDDPSASVSMFEPTAPKRERRARQATLSAFGEATPRTNGESIESSSGTDAPAATVSTPDASDPLVRARQRRQAAGYARSST